MIASFKDYKLPCGKTTGYPISTLFYYSGLSGMNASLKSLLCLSNACLGLLGSFIMDISCVMSLTRLSVWVSNFFAFLPKNPFS